MDSLWPGSQKEIAFIHYNSNNPHIFLGSLMFLQLSLPKLSFMWLQYLLFLSGLSLLAVTASPMALPLLLHIILSFLLAWRNGDAFFCQSRHRIRIEPEQGLEPWARGVLPQVSGYCFVPLPTIHSSVLCWQPSDKPTFTSMLSLALFKWSAQR